jgi:hypothetical protein
MSVRVYVYLDIFLRLSIPSAKITKLANSAAAAHGGSMVVNTEWGAFDNAVSVGPLALRFY